jgi:hypothetical protein
MAYGVGCVEARSEIARRKAQIANSWLFECSTDKQVVLARDNLACLFAVKNRGSERITSLKYVLCKAAQPDHTCRNCFLYQGHSGPHQTFVAQWTDGEEYARRRPRLTHHRDSFGCPESRRIDHVQNAIVSAANMRRRSMRTSSWTAK